MNKLTKTFWKYTIILLIVGAILVVVGGLSIGRSTINKTRELGLDMSAKARAELISNENRELKEENARLIREKEFAIADKVSAEKKTETVVSYLELAEIMEEKTPDYEKAKELVKIIDETLLPDSVKEQFSDYKKEIEKE